ncbi:MAG: tRNA-dihydrouridine synthase [Candidatus Woesebacteria bacterium]|nr:tRNA-dihydrouridine synthase [Candidatus Woesebacteria bacterium]
MSIKTINTTNFWRKLPRPFTVLAPMEGVTDYIFREIVANYLPKPDVLFTEFTNVEALNSLGLEKTIPRFKFSKEQKPIVAQIWGLKPENYYKTAKLIEKLGFDGIDINMGCPDRAVVKIGACSALINNHPLAKEIIEATKKGSKKLPISVKTRIGFKEVVTEEWITFLLEQKIDALTVHGRTSKQMSDIPANWKEIEKAVKIKDDISPSTIIIGNGDVKSYKEALKRVKESHVDGIMIGRGIFSNPWVFEKKVKEHSFEESKKILIKHLKLCDSGYSNDKVTSYETVKKFFKMYINNFNGANKLRSKLMETKSIEEALKLLK